MLTTAGRSAERTNVYTNKIVCSLSLEGFSVDLDRVIGLGEVPRTIDGQNWRVVKGQQPNISVVNNQTAEKSWSKHLHAVAVVTIGSM